VTTTDLLRQNSELRRDRVWNWTLPAWVARRSDGVAVNVCPQAGACIRVCYARNGTYNFPGVKAAHVRNLEAVQDDLGAWATAMLTELGRRKFRPSGEPRLPGYPRGHLAPAVADLIDRGAAAVRIHDAGDFFTDDYLLAWATIAELTPDVLFYAYTKEVARVRRVLGGGGPDNLLTVFSLGGKQDHLLDLAVDRHAEVFPDEAAIAAAGYESQDANDLLCVLSVNHRVGIPANNIPAFRKRLAGRTFGELEAATRRHGRDQVPA
jgi:hypothetical protein